MTWEQEVEAVLRRIGRRRGRAVTLQEYEPAYPDAKAVPDKQRMVLLRALQREDKMELYKSALERIEEKYALRMGRLVTFAQFRGMIAKEIESIAKGER